MSRQTRQGSFAWSIFVEFPKGDQQGDLRSGDMGLTHSLRYGIQDDLRYGPHTKFHTNEFEQLTPSDRDRRPVERYPHRTI